MLLVAGLEGVVGDALFAVGEDHDGESHFELGMQMSSATHSCILLRLIAKILVLTA